jgi:inosine-uridine nucleoside N-ribohydrolase
MRVWIDTDVGDNPDDAVALVCAAAHPAIELVGVSTTGGRTRWRAELARRLVTVEVVPGEQPDDVARAFGSAAPDALVAIGPLTNVAALLVVGAALPAVVAMGGALSPVRHRGRLRRVEWNFGADAGAAAVVVAGVDLTLVPLDVTVGMRLDSPALDRLLAADRRLVPEVERWQAQRDDPVVLHDPLALLVAADEPVVDIERRPIAVDPHDGAVREEGATREQDIVVSADTDAAIARVMEVLS